MSVNESNRNDSEHDLLCPLQALLEKPYGIAMSSCQCDLIARVREEERRQYSNYSNARNTGRRDGYAAALRDAVDAVAALPYLNAGAWVKRKDAIAAIEALGGES